MLSVLAALFLQQCHFLRQAGHSEKAVALFQAMVDFTFFKPDSVKELPTKGQVRAPPPPRSSLHPGVGLVGAPPLPHLPPPRGWGLWAVGLVFLK